MNLGSIIKHLTSKAKMNEIEVVRMSSLFSGDKLFHCFTIILLSFSISVSCTRSLMEPSSTFSSLLVPYRRCVNRDDDDGEGIEYDGDDGNGGDDDDGGGGCDTIDLRWPWL